MATRRRPPPPSIAVPTLPDQDEDENPIYDLGDDLDEFAEDGVNSDGEGYESPAEQQVPPRMNRELPPPPKTQMPALPTPTPTPARPKREPAAAVVNGNEAPPLPDRGARGRHIKPTTPCLPLPRVPSPPPKSSSAGSQKSTTVVASPPSNGNQHSPSAWSQNPARVPSPPPSARRQPLQSSPTARGPPFPSPPPDIGQPFASAQTARGNCPPSPPRARVERFPNTQSPQGAFAPPQKTKPSFLHAAKRGPPAASPKRQPPLPTEQLEDDEYLEPGEKITPASQPEEDYTPFVDEEALDEMYEDPDRPTSQISRPPPRQPKAPAGVACNVHVDAKLGPTKVKIMEQPLPPVPTANPDATEGVRPSPTARGIKPAPVTSGSQSVSDSIKDRQNKLNLSGMAAGMAGGPPVRGSGPKAASDTAVSPTRGKASGGVSMLPPGLNVQNLRANLKPTISPKPAASHGTTPSPNMPPTPLAPRTRGSPRVATPATTPESPPVAAVTPILSPRTAAAAPFLNRVLPAPPTEGEAIVNCGWYHGAITRKDSDRVLTKKDGHFLVRDASKPSKQQPYTLVLIWKDRTYNLKIRKLSDGSYGIGEEKDGEETYDCVQDLISYHKQNPIELSKQSTTPTNGFLKEFPPRQ